jgi:hypothetical protein
LTACVSFNTIAVAQTTIAPETPPAQPSAKQLD